MTGLMTGRVPWQPGSLWQKLEAQTAHGLSVGALQSIETTVERVDDGDIHFFVYVLANLARKEKARTQQGKTTPVNPFLPHEEDLYVTDILETHLCLLNKFNVVDHHFLIVTRAFEPQENWLTLADFEALAYCLGEVDGLAFFNGGTLAGASQPHKHLQVLPRLGEMATFPIEAIIRKGDVKQFVAAETVLASGANQLPSLPFRHAIALLAFEPNDVPRNAKKMAQQYLSQYRALLTAVGIDSENEWCDTQTAPYNLLCTRQWMMIVPRSQEKFAGISVNSLGFAGSLLVKNQQTLEALKAIGPVTLLEHVGYSRD